MKKQMRFEIHESAFHGGGVLARASTLENAMDRQHRLNKWERDSGCECGGCVIVDASGELDADDLQWKMIRIEDARRRN